MRAAGVPSGDVAVVWVGLCCCIDYGYRHTEGARNI